VDLAEVEATLLAEGGAFEIVDVEIDGVTIRSFKNRIRTLRDLLLKSPDFGDHTYMLATDGVTERRISFAEHARLVASVAAALRDRYDVQPGDRVAILGANCPEWVIAFWAAISLGAIAVGLNAWSTGPEIRYFVDDCDPKVLIADRKRVERLSGDDPGVPVVVMEDDFADLETYASDAGFADVEVAEDDPAIILYTSGTTGRPKGAINTHRNVASYLMLNFYNGAKAMMLAPPPAPDDPPPLPTCQLVSSPLFHVSGLHSAAVMMLATGLKSVWLMGRFDAAVAMQVIEREQCTGWSFTETVLHRLVNPPRRREVRPVVDQERRRRRFTGRAVVARTHAARLPQRESQRRERLRADGMRRARDAQQWRGAHRVPAVGRASATDGRARDPRSARKCAPRG
jgi:long-chain acyl-CoA synthetase